MTLSDYNRGVVRNIFFFFLAEMIVKPFGNHSNFFSFISREFNFDQCVALSDRQITVLTYLGGDVAQSN